MRYVVLLSLASLFACGDGSDDGDGPPGSRDARCVGNPVQAYDVDDSSSCSRQGSEWDSTNHECRGTTFVVHCSRADESGLPEEAVRGMCLDMPGCGWTRADGTIEQPTGHCEGMAIPCNAFDDDSTCTQQPGCMYFSSEGCTDRNGFNYLDNVDCGALQIGDSVSFSVVRSACMRKMGCTWLDP